MTFFGIDVAPLKEQRRVNTGSVVSILSLQAEAQRVHYQQLENETMAKSGIIVCLVDALPGRFGEVGTLVIETAQQGVFTLCHMIVFF